MAFGKKKKTEEPGFGEPAAATAKSKKPLLVMVVVIAAVIVFTCTLAFGKKIMAKDNKVKAPVVVEKGTIVDLDEFLVNLNDEGSDHFLKVTLALEFTKKSGKTTESLKDDTARVRDAVLDALSTKSRADVSSIGGKDKLKQEIKDSVNKELGDKEVLNVYYVNFVTQ